LLVRAIFDSHSDNELISFYLDLREGCGNENRKHNQTAQKEEEERGEINMKNISFLVAFVATISLLSLTAKADILEEIPMFIEIDENVTLITGTPVSRVFSRATSTEREILEGESVKKNLLQITQINGRFYWTSRGNVELKHKISGFPTRSSASGRIPSTFFLLALCVSSHVAVPAGSSLRSVYSEVENARFDIARQWPLVNA